MKRRGDLDKRSKNQKRRERISGVLGEIRYSVDLGSVISVCPICGKEVYKDPSNIVFEDVYFHFSCVVELIKSSVELSENQNVYYYGSNNFAIIWERRDKFEVLSKIKVGEFLNSYVKKSV